MEIWENFLVGSKDLFQFLSGVDLHLHSFYSDGLLSPEEIVTQASKRGYGLISITDHDSVSAYCKDSVFKLGKKLGVDLIAGAEIDCGSGLDILVYDQLPGKTSFNFSKKLT